MRKRYLAVILAAMIALPQVWGTGQVVYASQAEEESEAEAADEESVSENVENELPGTEAADAEQKDIDRGNARQEIPDVQNPEEEKQSESAEPEKVLEEKSEVHVTEKAKNSSVMPLSANGIWEFYIEGDDNTASIVWEGKWDSDFELPKGVTYDQTKNELNLNQANIGQILYNGEKALTIHLNNSSIEELTYIASGDLTVDVSGQNQLTIMSYAYKWGSGAGDIYVSGNGTIEPKPDEYACAYFLDQQSWTTDEDRNFVLSDAGDVYIDGVTIIVPNGYGIASRNSNVTIRNAVLKINEQASSEFWTGITTGMIENTGGLLTIENSEIEIKKCSTALAWNAIKLTGCNLYMGESSAEYQVDPTKAAQCDSSGDYKRWYYKDIGYLKITKEKLNLPSAHAIINETDSYSNHWITMPAFALAGEKIDIGVTYPSTEYTLSKIYVNGEVLSGTSFIMPDHETTVKAVFVKKAGNGTSSGKEVSKTQEVKVSRVSISGISKKIAAGKKITLKAAISPSNASNKAVTWKSSNTKYATVSSKGVVTMKKAGAGKTVKITATAKDGSKKTASYKIKCMKGVVKKIKLTASKTVKAGKKVTVKKKVTASKGANTTLSYSVSNKKYATVNSKGVVTAKKAGKGKTVTVTAKATDGSGKKATVKIKIK